MNRITSLKTKLITQRFEETREWYRELLGLFLLEEWNEPDDRGCILGFGGERSEALLEIYQGQPEFDFSGLSLQFRVEDVDDFKAPEDPRFAFRGPVERPWGSRYLFFSGPNDVSVVIFSGSSL